MITIAPDQTLDLAHGASYLLSAESPSAFLVASREGDISILTSAVRDVARLRLSSKNIDDISVHPTAGLIAVTGDKSGALHILRFDGTIVASLTPPRSDGNGAFGAQAAYESCIFAENGSKLWCAAPQLNGMIAVQLRETNDWSILATTEIEDPFGESSTLFDRGNGRGVTTLWLAAGQDGQQVYWAAFADGQYRCTLEPMLRDTPPPDFSPDGRELLVVEGAGTLARYDFPPQRMLGSCESPEGYDDAFAERVRYLDSRHAIVRTNNGRIFLIDVQAMQVRDEIAILGHEPRPVEEVYPTLRGDRSLCTDIAYFERLGDMLAVVYRRDFGTGLEERRNGVAFVPVKALIR